MTPIVLDASAGVELALQTPIGRRLQARITAGATTWVPEHYYAEAVAVLRRDEIHQRYDPSRIQVALDRLLSAPATRVSAKTAVDRGIATPSQTRPSPTPCTSSLASTSMRRW